MKWHLHYLHQVHNESGAVSEVCIKKKMTQHLGQKLHD